jgi:flagellar basal-body rod modification protein FlgD
MTDGEPAMALPISMLKSGAATNNAADATNAASNAARNDSEAAAAADAAKEASDRFLTLLVTQLRNQDPLNPLDNAQVTTQLAQLSTVSGINKLNETVASLSASFAAGQYLQAMGLVDREVVVAGDKLALEEGKAQYGMAIAKDPRHPPRARRLAAHRCQRPRLCPAV